MVDERPAAYRLTYSPSQLAWAEGRRPIFHFHNVFIDEVKVSKPALKCSRKINYLN